jgi:NAD(P)-dependent dehydrogenase (short-subunit alcohol dehydrogenase family)
MKKLEGKVALVTGGSSGIGLATAHLFAREGAFVYITGRRQQELDAAVSQIGKNVTSVQGDIANLADLDRLYATVERQHGRLDVLFANAGGGVKGLLGDISEADVDTTVNVNLKGTLFTVQKVLPLLQNGGSIILTSSIGGSIILTSSIGGSKGQIALGMYGATKAAVRSFARTWALELSPRQIRVNVISPGPINTPLLQSVGETEEQTKQIIASALSTMPMGRVGDPDEVAKAVLFLALDDSSFITGIELFVDGA